MSNRAKEKSQNRNTKDKDILDLDNEIIIGIKSLPKQKKTKSPQKKKTTKNTKKKVTSKSGKQKEGTRKNTKKKKIQNDDVELRLGIEDEIYKEKKKQVKKKPKLTKKQQEIARKKRKIIFRLIKWTSLVMLLIGGSRSEERR